MMQGIHVCFIHNMISLLRLGGGGGGGGGDPHPR